jgi:23S rRNA (guanine1835-N2)-methyltransferase
MDEHDILTVPQGSFDLRRLHDGGDSPLRAWDAADEYVLTHLADTHLSTRGIAIVNDGHGALTVALADREPFSISDSYVSRLATIANLRRNGVDPDLVEMTASVEQLFDRDEISIAIIKVPKSLGLLDHQLRQLRSRLGTDAVVIGAGMTRHIHSSTIESFESAIGPTTHVAGP